MERKAAKKETGKRIKQVDVATVEKLRLHAQNKGFWEISG